MAIAPQEALQIALEEWNFPALKKVHYEVKVQNTLEEPDFMKMCCVFSFKFDIKRCPGMPIIARS